MSYGSNFALTLFTNDPALAARADRAGVDRIGVDIERLGKPVRQGHLATWISDHVEGDLARLAPALNDAALFARCNPLHDGTGDEVDRLLALGVNVIMLPYFTSVAEADSFIRVVDGRAYPVLLVETAAAAARIDELCRIDGVREIHVGLNDMRLSLGWPSHFHVLASRMLRGLCDAVLNAGIRLGIGGLGRAGDDGLPVPADLVAAQLARLGATAALISRAFFREPVADLTLEIGRVRRLLDDCAAQPPAWHEQRHAELEACIARLFPARVPDGATGVIDPSAPVSRPETVG